MVNVDYVDGPPVRDVERIAQAFEGRKFNGSTDSYDDCGTVLVAGTGDAMPDEARYLCDGVIVQRRYSSTAHLEAQRIIATDSTIRHLVVCDDAGTLLLGNLIDPADEFAVVSGHVVNSPYIDAHQLVATALQDRNLTPTRTNR